MRSFEWIACAYFGYFVVACWWPRLPAARRTFLIGASAVAAGAVVAVARAEISWVRELAPIAYILVGYFLSGYLFASPSIAVESWLMRWDRRLLGDPSTRFISWPRVLVAGLELIYMGCFLMIPAGAGLLALTGHAGLVDRYWSMVISAEFLAFGPLAFIQTRPPWVLERKPELADKAIHRLAVQMVEHLSIRVNTFPSGTRPVRSRSGSPSWAAALGRRGASGLAAGVCVACVVGRYHYVIDVVAGAFVAFTLWLVN